MGDRPTLLLNGSPVTPVRCNGYALVERRWRAGDTLRLSLPMTVAAEAVPDDPTVAAFTRGPVVLAADLGPASEPFDGTAPALVATGTPLPAAVASAPATFGIAAATGGRLTLRPFAAQYDRRAAVYFPTFTPARWETVKSDYVRAQAEAVALTRRTVDTLHLGEMQPERDHAVEPGRTEVVNWNGRSARHLRRGDRIRCRLARRPGAATLRILVWGDFDRTIAVRVDGTDAGSASRHAPHEDRFAYINHPLPAAGEQGRDAALVELEAVDGDAVIYEVGMLATPEAVPPTRAA